MYWANHDLFKHLFQLLPNLLTGQRRRPVTRLGKKAPCVSSIELLFIFSINFKMKPQLLHSINSTSKREKTLRYFECSEHNKIYSQNAKMFVLLSM